MLVEKGTLAIYEIQFAKGWKELTDKDLPHWKVFHYKLRKCADNFEAFKLGQLMAYKDLQDRLASL